MATSTLPIELPAPTSPAAATAWYAPSVRAQYEIGPELVVTIKQKGGQFQYELREPPLSPQLEAAREELCTTVDNQDGKRPLTRERTRERMAAPLPTAWQQRLATHVSQPAAKRRLRYYLACERQGLGSLTPLALDTRIEMADTEGDRLIVHTDRFAPVTTSIEGDQELLSRVVSERLTRYTVSFQEYEIPVVVYREQLIGGDTFKTKYAVREPTLGEGDRALIEECKDRIWETTVDGLVEDQAAYIRERAVEIFTQLLADQQERGVMNRIHTQLQSLLGSAPTDQSPAQCEETDRIDRLVYYVLRDFIGESKLTIPIRDPHLEDIEANRVGERIKVVPRMARMDSQRIPTNLEFADEQRFINVVTQIAAADGVELTASDPSAKVNLDPPEVSSTATIRCAVALPVISEDGPHVSIRKQAAQSLTPVDLIRQGAISPRLVALLWMLYEHRCVVLFSGPTGAGKTTLMNAHMPFISVDDRPIAIDEGSREVHVPHETGVALSTREYGDDREDISMAALMTECNYLNPDIEVIAEINTPESFRTFGESMNTGHGIVGTTHAEDTETLVNRMLEQGIAPYLLRELDLVLFPKQIDGQRYVTEAVEFLTQESYEKIDGPAGAIDKGEETIYWNQVSVRDENGSFHFGYTHPRLNQDETAASGKRDIGHRLEESAFGAPTETATPGDTAAGPSCDIRVFHRIAARTDRPVQAVEAEFHRKLRYVQYLKQEGIEDFQTLFGFLSDLHADEAATVERIQRSLR